MKPSQAAAPPGHEYPENLSVLERRGGLNAASRRRLELCLASSNTLLVLHELGHRFDEVPEKLPEDNALLTKMAACAVQRFAGKPAHQRPRMRLRGKVALFTGAALLLGTLSAAAALWTRLEIHFRPSAHSSTPQARVIGLRKSSQRPVAPVAPPTASTTEREPTVAQPNETKVATKRLQSGPVEPPNRGNDSAGEAAEWIGPSELFSAGNAARRTGALSRAVSLYHDLESRYPKSDEALLAHMMLGRLELSRGNAGRALVAYERYLQAAPSGALAQEALQGKAQALHALGIKDEERAAWQELLHRFPTSAYSEAAREHLSEGR